MKREQQKNASGTNIAIGGNTNVSPSKTIVNQSTSIGNPNAVAKQVGASG